MNTVAPIQPGERPYRQIGDLAQCAWCGEQASARAKASLTFGQNARRVHSPARRARNRRTRSRV